MDPAAPAVQSAAIPAYPVRLDLDAPNKIARWRPFVHFIMAIPHLFISRALSALGGVVTFIAFFAILFTKTYPEGLFKVSVMAQRYSWRVTSFVFYLREAYPPFEFSSELEDPGTDPARLSIDYPGEMSRWLPFVKFFLAIPHFFVLLFLFIGGAVVWFLSFFAVLFTGRYPEGMRNYMVGVSRWGQRVSAYVGLMTDDYPPFSLQ
jgi:hypothetical protein